MDDVTPPVSPHVSSEGADLEAFKDNSDDLISGESHIKLQPSSPNISDEPREILVAIDNPIIDSERADLEAIKDDSDELILGESIIKLQFSSPISDEPRELLVAIDTPIIDEEPSALQNVQKEEEVLEKEPQDDDNTRVGISAEDEKPTEESEVSVKESDLAAYCTPVDVDKVIIDTSAPIESVKDAVSKFGGLVVRKAHKTLASEKSEITEEKLEKAKEEIPVLKQQAQAALGAKAQALKELDVTHRLIEELKRNLERAQAEECQAKQDSQHAKMRIKEIDVEADSELKCVKEEVEALQRECSSMLCEKDAAVKRAEEAQSKCKEIEKTVEEMNVELASMKERLECARAAHMEAEEQKNVADMNGKRDSLVREKEVKELEEDMERLSQQVEVERELKGKLNRGLDLLASLKSELVAYEELKQQRGEENNDEAKNELEELRVKTEKRREEVNSLKAVSIELKKELDQEKSELESVKEREGMALMDVGSVRAELERIKSEFSAAKIREKEAEDRMVKLPELLEVASQEADEAKSVAEEAREGLRKVQEESKQAKEGASAMESQLLSVQREIEAGKASEKQTMDAIKALQERESNWSNDEGDTPDQVTVPLEEYNELRKRAQEAEEKANLKVVAAIAEVDTAREAEMESVRKLEEAKGELVTRKEVYAHAAHKAEKENEAMIVVQQELKRWSAENKERREADSPRGGTEGQGAHTAPPHPILTSNKESTGSESSPLDSPRLSSPDTKAGKKKKKHYFPRFFMYFSKKKTQSHTS